MHIRTLLITSAAAVLMAGAALAQDATEATAQQGVLVYEPAFFADASDSVSLSPPNSASAFELSAQLFLTSSICACCFSAIAGAILNGIGATIRELPITAEKIFNALQETK